MAAKTAEEVQKLTDAEVFELVVVARKEEVTREVPAFSDRQYCLQYADAATPPEKQGLYCGKVRLADVCSPEQVAAIEAGLARACLAEP